MKFQKQIDINVPVEAAFKWHEQPGALARLLPPFEDVRVHHSTGGIEHGARVEMSVPMGPLRKRWVAEHRDYVPNERFTDVQLRGPFAHWEHTHLFERRDSNSCTLIDSVDYRLPMGSVGRTFGGSTVARMLETMFRFRHERTKSDLELHHAFRDQPRMKILISGSTGLIGSALIPFLTTGGHDVYRLVRDEEHARLNPQAVYWNIKEGEVNRQELEGFDAVIHLGGANIAGHRWTKKYKETIKNSRVKSTQLLAGLLATLHKKPKVLVSASAVGFYGDRGDEILTEQTTSGLGFLPEVARAWEEAAKPAADAGIRVVHPRFGIVLSPNGGALKEMQRPFRWGVGGVVGSGRQYWSSISLDDAISAIYFAIMRDDVSGPMNITMPEQTTCRQFVKTLGSVLNRPTVLPLPSPAVHAIMGEMGEALLLHSTRAVPEKLQAINFPFRHPTLREAMEFSLGRFQQK